MLCERFCSWDKLKKRLRTLLEICLKPSLGAKSESTIPTSFSEQFWQPFVRFLTDFHNSFARVTLGPWGVLFLMPVNPYWPVGGRKVTSDLFFEGWVTHIKTLLSPLKYVTSQNSLEGLEIMSSECFSKKGSLLRSFVWPLLHFPT